MPVYEIYKVGEDLGWKAGLNLLGPFGRNVAIVPHWNNHEGGEELDTSHSFMGQERFERLLGLLPSDVDVVGIDEHTALMLDFAAGMAVVFGRGGVSWLHDGSTTRLDAGASMPLAALGLTRQPESSDGHSAGGVGRRLSHGPFEQPGAGAARAGARARHGPGPSPRQR